MVSPHYRAAIGAIKVARNEQGVSQRELARRLGRPPSFVNKIEQLERRLDVVEFIAIARALDLNPEILLKSVIEALGADIQL